MKPDGFILWKEPRVDKDRNSDNNRDWDDAPSPPKPDTTQWLSL